MKKSAHRLQKLQLNRETLTNLTQGEIQRAAGGYSVRCSEVDSCPGASAYFICDPTLNACEYTYNCI